MKRIEALIAGLVDAIPEPQGDLLVTDLELTMPLETRLGSGSEILASLPRGRWRTGFALPHGHISARFVREES